ncbi:MAG: phosphoribosylglycinamide formyltransferase [Thiothrix sp.]|uniref:phosphoribosylglycinamide formyltransferase n=1 Tax=Thiothrix sp. TaxID=1032 RepID=UPI00262B4E7B|nr:phosphoribosylglycinamide formyltransferase [Thiothrix sp.]MDD5392954.1 phosphoribosylglycinamide formyltransferase [Thiothrix sp.]
MSIDESTALPRLVVLISGSGSNLQSIIDAIRAQRLQAQIVAVISNKADAYGLQRASNAVIPAITVDHKGFASRAEFDQALQQQIDSYQPDLVVLAGFMRILTPDFVRHYTGRMLNIHPSLLPLYKGIHTHQRVLDDKAKEHGVSIHFVTPELDGGPVIMQAKVPVLPSDTAKSLAQRVQAQEHVIYPRVVKWFVEGRLKLEGNQVMLDGNVLKRPALHL